MLEYVSWVDIKVLSMFVLYFGVIVFIGRR